MTVLAIETATAVCGVAVVVDGRVCSEHELVAPHMHSQKLMSMVDDVLSEASTRGGKLGGIVISIGPGSFTGLRIGLSVAKGLAYAWKKPLAAVPTLEGLALNAALSNKISEKDLILPMIDARRSEVYVAGYRPLDRGIEEVLSVRAAQVEALVELAAGYERIVVTGDGVEKFAEFMRKEYPNRAPRFQFLLEHEARCKASGVGLIGETRLLRGSAADLESLEPLYVKEFHTLVKTQHSSAS